MFSSVIAESTNVYYNSVCLSVTALFFMVLILFTYFSKRKSSDISSKTFGALLIVCITVLILETICPYLIMHMDEHPTMNNLVNRLYMFIAYTWGTLFYVYIVLVIYGIDRFKKFDKKNMLFYISIIYAVVYPIIGSFIVNFEYNGGINGMPYSITGIALYMYYIYISLKKYQNLKDLNISKSYIYQTYKKKK